MGTTTARYQFPSAADAHLAALTLDEIADSAEGIESLAGQPQDDGVVLVEAVFGLDADEECEAGLDALLDSWASATEGYAV